jgi:hypothetical protein
VHTGTPEVSVASRPALPTVEIGLTRECRRCLRHERDGGGFQLVGPDGPETRCLPCSVCHPPLLRRSLAIASIVGSVLVAINQGDALLAGTWSAALFWKLPLTYAVPFIVATWGALGASRVSRR